MEAMDKFKEYLSKLNEQLEMTDSDREKYTKYLNSLSKEEREYFSSAMRKIGNSKKQSDFRNWLGFDEPDETKSFRRNFSVNQSVDDSEDDTSNMGLSSEETEIIKTTAEETMAIVRKENPEATEQEIKDKAEAEVIKAPDVQALVNKEADKQSVKAAVEKTVEKEVSPDEETFPLDKEFITLANKISKFNTLALVQNDTDAAQKRNDLAEEYRQLIEKNKNNDIEGGGAAPDESFLSGETDKNMYRFIGHKDEELKTYFSGKEIEGIVSHYSSIKVGSKEDQPIYILKPAVIKADGKTIKGEAILAPAGSKKSEEPEGTTGSKIDNVMEMAKKMVGKAVGKKVIKSISVNEMKQTDDPFSKTGIEHKELSAFPEEATGDFKSLMQQVGGPSKMYNRLIKNKINPEKPFVYMEFREGETRVYSVDKFLLSPPEVKEESLQEELANKLKPLIKEMLTKGNKK
tara:strand:- start:853 stop:2235 length:1383 start_codon:yes stop_codon:yes gene_type:complete